MPTEYCRHIKANGVRCGSPALRGKPRCYFHDRTTTQRRLAEQHRRDALAITHHPLHPGPEGAQREPILAERFQPSPLELDFPTLEDRPSIQLALSMLLGALGRNELDPRRAGMMLYGLQVASSNAKLFTATNKDTVRETVLDENGTEIAPDEDPEEQDEPEEWTATDRLMLKIAGLV